MRMILTHRLEITVKWNYGHEQSEAMPVDSCLIFYSCKGCGMTLRPATGDCCTFCTFGSVACPPKQKQTMNMA